MLILSEGTYDGIDVLSRKLVVHMRELKIKGVKCLCDLVHPVVPMFPIIIVSHLYSFVHS